MASLILVAVAASAAGIALCWAPAAAQDKAGADAPAPVKTLAAPDATPGKAAGAAGVAVKRVILTRKAAERLGIELDEVRVDPAGRLIVPYTSVLYDVNGKTWVYIRADDLTFVRELVSIDIIQGANVYIKEGPPAGTRILAVGVPQVFGTEVKVGH